MIAGRSGAWRGWSLAAGVLIGGCAAGSHTVPPVEVAWTLQPSTPVAGPALLMVRLRGPSGDPVTGATVRLEAHMTHPGMAPVVATAVEGAPGRYDLPFAFTMPGDWVLIVSAALANGQRVERRIDVANVRPSG